MNTPSACQIELGVSERMRHDIDKQVDRVLKEMGNPEPPLDLESVRGLLRLDLRFFSTANPTWLEGKIHTLRIAGHNILHEPRRLLEVVRKLSLKALVLPERRQILIDSDLPSPKQRWSESHEIVHTILSWHAPYCHGDRERTLTEDCHATIEAEANYGSGRLLFLAERFREEVRSAPIPMDRVRKLAKLYGNSLTSTLWRTTEHATQPVLGMVSVHPWDQPTDVNAPKVRRMFCSPPFAERFTSVHPDLVLKTLARVVTRKGGGLVGAGSLRLTDANGDEHEFQAECFSNTHDILSLLVHVRAVSKAIVIP